MVFKSGKNSHVYIYLLLFNLIVVKEVENSNHGGHIWEWLLLPHKEAGSFLGSSFSGSYSSAWWILCGGTQSWPNILSLFFLVIFGHTPWHMGFPSGSIVKNPPAMQELQETWVRSLVWKDPLEEERYPTPVYLPGKSHGQRSLAGYSLWGRVRHDWATELNWTEYTRCLSGKQEHTDQTYVSPSKNGKMLGLPWWSSG